MSHAFPESNRAAVDRALLAAFGTTELDAAVPLSGGLSGALIFRIRVGGIAYLLRIEGARDVFRDPGRWYRCMAIAAGALLAPRVRYASADDGVAIMEFIHERSLSMDYHGTKSDMLVEMGQTLRALHAAPAFPPLVFSSATLVLAMLQRVTIVRCDAKRQRARPMGSDMIPSG